MEAISTVVPHILVLFVTALLHFVCSTVISPRLVGALPRGAHRKSHMKEHQQYLALGQLVHSLLVSSLAVFSVLNYDSETLAKSWVALMAVEISLSFFEIELVTTLIYFPSTLLEDKMGLLHHISGIVGLLISLYWKGFLIKLAIIKLLSQLSVPFLILRLYLLDCGKSKTLSYLVVFSLMILVYFASRIAVIPWFWITFSEFVQRQEVATFLAVLEGFTSLTLDILNICWLKLMVYTYVKYFPVL